MSTTNLSRAEKMAELFDNVLMDWLKNGVKIFTNNGAPVWEVDDDGEPILGKQARKAITPEHARVILSRISHLGVKESRSTEDMNDGLNQRGRNLKLAKEMGNAG